MFLHDPYFLIRGGLYLAACEFLHRIYSRPRGPQEVFRASWSYRGLAWISVVVSTYFLWQIATGYASRTLNSIWTWAFFILAVIGLIQFPSVVAADEGESSSGTSCFAASASAGLTSSRSHNTGKRVPLILGRAVRALQFSVATAPKSAFHSGTSSKIASSGGFVTTSR